MKNYSEFEEALMGYLTDFKLQDDILKKYSHAILDLSKNDIWIERIWKVGQPPIDGAFRADGVGLKSRIPINEIHRLNEILRLKDVYSVEVFPIGIIEPEFLDVQFELNNSPLKR